MKRVKAACIMQTLVFSQKPELEYSYEEALKINREEVEHYISLLEHQKVRHVIVDKIEQEDGSILVRVKKQYNDTADVAEYF